MRWKRWLFLSHRYLGIGCCVLFLLWFVSGIVMMYSRMPQLNPNERFQKFASLEPSQIRLSARQAFLRSGLSEPLKRIRLGMLTGRPVYRFLSSKDSWVTIFADDGSRLLGVTAEQLLEVARDFRPFNTDMFQHKKILDVPDQWTLSSALNPYRPLHHIAVADKEGTELYVSQTTGEVVLHTTWRRRLLAYFGAIIHWIYFTPVRRHSEVWRQAIIWLSGIGSAMCLLGIAIGLMRYSPKYRYRMRVRPRTSIPYAGWKRWHHSAGLLFGLFTFTWILSGMLSLNPGRWSPSKSPTLQQELAFRGGPLNPLLFTANLSLALSELESQLQPKEIELIQFLGQPFYLVYESPSKTLLLGADGTGHGKITTFKQDELMRAAQSAMPGADVSDAVLLKEYDAYYYHRDRVKRLPVLRVRFRDPKETWLYIDPHTGAIVEKYERRNRIERWMYHGLHSLDFPFLYYLRPAWDLVVIVLILGGTTLSLLGIVISWQRLRKIFRLAGSAHRENG